MIGLNDVHYGFMGKPDISRVIAENNTARCILVTTATSAVLLTNISASIIRKVRDSLPGAYSYFMHYSVEVIDNNHTIEGQLGNSLPEGWSLIMAQYVGNNCPHDQAVALRRLALKLRKVERTAKRPRTQVEVIS